jgi:hypothetical protein
MDMLLLEELVLQGQKARGRSVHVAWQSPTKANASPSPFITHTQLTPLVSDNFDNYNNYNNTGQYHHMLVNYTPNLVA